MVIVFVQKKSIQFQYPFNPFEVYKQLWDGYGSNELDNKGIIYYIMDIKINIHTVAYELSVHCI